MNVSYWQGLLGGILIGLAAVMLYWLNGRIMGVSGIMSRLLQKPSMDSWWRLSFIIGLVLGGILYPWPVTVELKASYVLVIAAGFLVGLGTVLGNGCTSGHGICGIARFSKRSMVATAIFMGTGIITVLLKRMWGL